MTEEKLLKQLKHWYTIAGEIDKHEEQQVYEKIEYIIKTHFDNGLDEFFKKSGKQQEV